MILSLRRYVERATTQNAEGYCASYDDTMSVPVEVRCEVWMDHGDLGDDVVDFLTGGDSLTEDEREEAEGDAVVEAWARLRLIQKEAEHIRLSSVRQRQDGKAA